MILLIILNFNLTLFPLLKHENLSKFYFKIKFMNFLEF